MPHLCRKFELCKRDGIRYAYSRPAYESQITAIGQYGIWPTQEVLQYRIHEWLLSNNAKPITIYDVAECMRKAYLRAFTKQNIHMVLK